MKSYNKSILAGHYARKMLEEAQSGDCAHEVINGYSFSLRPCKKKNVLSGSYVVEGRGSFPGGFSKLNIIKKYFRACENIHEKIQDFIVSALRQLSVEAQRVEAVIRLDKMVDPLISCRNFIKAVLRREKKLGISYYDNLTLKQVEDWQNWANKWLDRNK